MTTHIDEVRKALLSAQRVSCETEYAGNSEEYAAALSALSAHEEDVLKLRRKYELLLAAGLSCEAEVKELVEAVKRVMSLLDADIGGSPGSALEQLRDAIDKVKP